jgi:sulfane dehydrogenase subunit SoxC
MGRVFDLVLSLVVAAITSSRRDANVVNSAVLEGALIGGRRALASAARQNSEVHSATVRAIGSPMSKRQPEKTGIARRKLLAGGVALAGSAASVALPAGSAGAADDNLPPQVPSWMKEQGAPFLSPPYGQPSPFEKDVIRRPRAPTPTNTAASSMTPWQNLHGIITPNGLHFERHHAGVPAIDPDQHRLVLHGLVNRPLIFTMEDIVRFPSESRIYFLECSGNSFWTGNTPQSTVQHTHGEMSCCEWTGVRLSTVLDEAGLNPRATWMLAEGADAAGMTRSVPIDKALDDALLVYAQNGERLRPEQGYPLRLFLPGYEGNTNVKWLRRLKLGDQPFQTREETSKYTDLMPDGTARQFTFVMEAKSVITFPSGGHLLHEKGFYEISGLAWSGHGRIMRVDVSTDGGESWKEARLQQPILPKCLTRFRLSWNWDGSPTQLQSRTVDETGYVQPTRAQLVDVRGLHSNYHYNAIQTWQVAQDGLVTNVV